MSYKSSLMDVVDRDYVGGTITVGTTPVIAKVGASNLAMRQELIIHNPSSAMVFFGPAGVTTTTGIPIGPDTCIVFQYGPNLDVYLVAETEGNTVIIQEAS